MLHHLADAGVYTFLPMYPELRDEQVEYIADAIRSVAGIA
ncbi:MAG: DegT/DnrJ/EryC1/StrS family aminotransferase [Gammaproteobacteria bacterium]|nr:DegT/DnrJ/EryC1/StrS family aminotransferase [Gammaproteobacteria bacterium]MCW9057585.1 DegT/DnrJ/EryC1/StrS family aminotransferase [Gammaproteobacteria bacterium]